MRVPEIAFTGDTSGGFLQLGAEHDVFRARLLIMELTFLDAQRTVEEAQVCDESSIGCSMLFRTCTSELVRTKMTSAKS